MPLDRTPLEPTVLSEAAHKALGAGPLKMMAARGLAPLPRPVDLASVIYQLALDADASIKAAAEKTAGELPEKVLAGALADPAIDARVIDFFAGKVLAKPTLLEALLLNKAIADETVVDLARRVGEREVEIIATNEQRLLRVPAVVGAMYMNPKARMSTVNRAVELAVRNNVVVPGVPAWNEVVHAVLGLKPEAEPAPEEQDQMFAAAAALAVGDSDEAAAAAEMLMQEEIPEETVENIRGKRDIDRLSIPMKVRLATIGNTFARSVLIRDSNRLVAMAAIRSPTISDDEVVKYAANRVLPQDVIRVIADTKEWTKLYAVKKHLVSNPKCPLPNAMRLLPLLHEKDIREISKSRSVPSALVAQARHLLEAKDSAKRR